MLHSHRRSTRRPAASTFAWLMLASATTLVCPLAVAQQASDLRLSRYTTASPTPDPAQVDPLEAVVQIGFPRSNVHSVGDAIGYLLLRTGYRLSPLTEAGTQTGAVLALPLPEVHRRLGPCTVRTALSVLLGRPYTLSVDATRRLVSYRLDAPANAVSEEVAGMSRTSPARDGNGGTR